MHNLFTISVCSAHGGAIFAPIGHACGAQAAAGERSDGPVCVCLTGVSASVSKPQAENEGVSKPSPRQDRVLRLGTELRACVMRELTPPSKNESIAERYVLRVTLRWLSRYTVAETSVWSRYEDTVCIMFAHV